MSEKRPANFLISRIRKIQRSLDSLVNSVAYQISPSTARNFLFLRKMGRALNLAAPRDFNEKIQWILANSNFVEFARYADKYSAREIVKATIGDHLLPSVFGVFSSPEDIDWKSLPDRYVLKCTHGCGFNILVPDSIDLDLEYARRELRRYLSSNIGFISLELQYFLIKPRILVEEYLGPTSRQDSLVDYKIYCFDGIPRVVLVCSDRKRQIKLDFFDLNWNWLPYAKPQFQSAEPVEPPASLAEMLQHARALASPFKFVRIDFYEVEEKAIFGEFTFSPGGGLATYYSDRGLRELGDMIVV